MYAYIYTYVFMYIHFVYVTEFKLEDVCKICKYIYMYMYVLAVGPAASQNVFSFSH